MTAQNEINSRRPDLQYLQVGEPQEDDGEVTTASSDDSTKLLQAWQDYRYKPTQQPGELHIVNQKHRDCYSIDVFIEWLERYNRSDYSKKDFKKQLDYVKGDLDE